MHRCTAVPPPMPIMDHIESQTYDVKYVSDDEFGEKSVSVLLDGEESEIVFIDHPAHEMSVSGRLPSSLASCREPLP